MIPKTYQILTHNVKGVGTFAWEKVIICARELCIGLVYAPKERGQRIALWKWLAANLAKEK